MGNENIAESVDQLPSVEVNVQANNHGEGVISNAAESSFAVGKSPSLKGPPDVERSGGIGGLGESTPKSERSDDMLRDDIFGESPAGVRKIYVVKRKAVGIWGCKDCGKVKAGGAYSLTP